MTNGEPSALERQLETKHATDLDSNFLSKAIELLGQSQPKSLDTQNANTVPPDFPRACISNVSPEQGFEKLGIDTASGARQTEPIRPADPKPTDGSTGSPRAIAKFPQDSEIQMCSLLLQAKPLEPHQPNIYACSVKGNLKQPEPPQIHACSIIQDRRSEEPPPSYMNSPENLDTKNKSKT